MVQLQVKNTQLTASYPHQLAGHCGSGSLRDLLEFHALDYGAGPLGEGMCFGLAGGLGFFYLEIPDFTPPFYLVGRTGEMEEDVAGHIGVGLELRETEDADEAWNLVRAEVDAGRPPMVWADIAELEYLRVRMSNTRHDIVIVGYDEEEGIAWVADNDRHELQACSLESLAGARSSNGFPGPNNARTFLYDWPEQLRPPDEACRLAIRKAVSNMSGDTQEVFGLKAYAGIAGVNRFAERYPLWPELFGDSLDAALGALRVLIVKAGTGGAFFRSLHADFLRDAGLLLGDKRLSDLAAHYDELATTWTALGELAGARRFEDGLELVSRIERMEGEGAHAMEAWLG